MINNDDTNAFPYPISANGIAEPQQSRGMTLRDYFAAKALQGQLAAQTEESGFWLEEQYPVVARICYSIADAMMKERSK